GCVLVYEFKDITDLSKWVSENTKKIVENKKFAVKVKRSGSHAFTSLDIAREIGSQLRPYAAGVDLENPDVLIELEVRGNNAYLYTNVIKGPGGLPIGTEGNALVLFSGGFDSPVASWLIAKRGVQVDFLHYVMGSTQSSYYALKVAKELALNWLHGYRPKFYVVDFRDILVEISQKTKWRLRQILLRSLMYMVASRIADTYNYHAIITGESIGQASSQTLRNLVAIDKAIKLGKPVLRPLLGFDKEEIISISRKIGLYDISSKVAETCALAPSRVETAAKPEEILEELGKLDLSLIDKAISSLRSLDLLDANLEDVIPPSDIEVDFIPENSLIIDMRGVEERNSNPIEGSIPLDEIDPNKLPRDKVILLLCETGIRSYITAKILREKGFKTYSLKGGANKYCKYK
ncbi:MAG: THUMP domain-containing protein, partial [Desulfurococcaceae archaeon]